MATGSNIRTFFEGSWHSEDKFIMRAADHGSWLGTSVFDGARFVDGVAPDLLAHCDRVNKSAEAMMITPNVSSNEMVEIILDGLKKFNSKIEGDILAASDAFFPFVDGIETLVQSGVTAVIQPSGSIRDKEIIKYANDAGIVLVFSKTRHFRH